MDRRQPSAVVLQAFGVADPVFLPGGAGTSWRAGDLVLKPGSDSVEPLAWLASLPATHAVRTARPVRTVDGRYVVDGWSAMPFLAGHHRTNAWAEVVAAGRSLSAEFAGIAALPVWIKQRKDPWAVADRVAWGEAVLPDSAPRWLRELAERRAPILGASQLVHGDLTGNVLFEPGLPAAVLDFSPYWRPLEYAAAIVVVDAVCFEGAPRRTGNLVRGLDARQLILRASLFRAVTDVLLGLLPDEQRYSPAVTLL